MSAPALQLGASSTGGPAPSPIAVLRRGGRSFHFAGRLLDSRRRNDAARLYRFCRYLDDCVDESRDPERARRRLDQVRVALTHGRTSVPWIADFLALADQHQLDLEAARQLTVGLEEDLQPVAVSDMDQLLVYAYRVAGTVGMMMTGVLGAPDARAVPHAIDLGIAMQLTNVARDVVEDARRGRRYLPDETLSRLPVASLARGGPEVREPGRRAVRRVLSTAERYYRSAEQGLAFLPTSRERFAILVAARVYREIGTELARQAHEPWRGRAIVGPRRKLTIAIQCALSLTSRGGLRRRPEAHDGRLHAPLRGLPGVSPGGSLSEEVA